MANWIPVPVICEVCKRDAHEVLKAGNWVGTMFQVMNVSGETKMCCSDCQRTVQTLYKLDKVVNGG